MKIIVIEPNKMPEVRDISGDSNQQYESVREIIGGYLQVLPFHDKADAYVDEDAKVNGVKITENVLATFLWQAFLSSRNLIMMPGDFIVNNFVIIGKCNQNGELDGEWHDVPNDVINLVMETAKGIQKMIDSLDRNRNR